MIYFLQNENVNHWKILTDTNHQELQFWYLNEIFERTSLIPFICSIRPTLITTFVMASPPHLVSVMSPVSSESELTWVTPSNPSAALSTLDMFKLTKMIRLPSFAGWGTKPGLSSDDDQGLRPGSLLTSFVTRECESFQP